MAATKTAVKNTFDVSGVIAAYNQADKAEKAKIRATLSAQMRSAIMAGDLQLAQAIMTAQNECKGNNNEPKAEVDFADVLAARIATLRAAADALESGKLVPAGFPDGFVFDGRTGSADEETASKIATTKVTRTRSGERHSIEEVIERAFEGLESGATLKVSEIARRGAIEGYNPSQGAIAARINSKSGVVGYKVLERNANGPLRLEKI